MCVFVCVCVCVCVCFRLWGGSLLACCCVKKHLYLKLCSISPSLSSLSSPPFSPSFKQIFSFVYVFPHRKNYLFLTHDFIPIFSSSIFFQAYSILLHFSFISREDLEELFCYANTETEKKLNQRRKKPGIYSALSLSLFFSSFYLYPVDT